MIRNWCSWAGILKEVDPRQEGGNDCPWEEYWSDMTIAQTGEPTSQKPLRLWPGVAAVVLQWLVRFGVPMVVPGAIVFAVLGGFLGGLAIVVWWAFFSRAPRVERWGAVVLMIVALGATSRILHNSIATGMMGMMFPIYAIPVLSLGFVVWAVVSRRLPDGPRRATMVAAILLACGVWALLRTNGITGSAASDFAWRWAKTPEERLLAQAVAEPAALPATPAPSAAAKTGADWPGFRGPHRDSVIPGVRIETDWSASPPVELWRRPIGPGWSSFAVRGDLLYTQEQRGDDEVVACYNADHRQAGVDTPRRGPILGVEWRRRSARDTDPQQWSRIHIWCDRNPECAQRR